MGRARAGPNVTVGRLRAAAKLAVSQARQWCVGRAACCVPARMRRQHAFPPISILVGVVLSFHSNWKWNSMAAAAAPAADIDEPCRRRRCLACSEFA
jgi:hypothetical protein